MSQRIIRLQRRSEPAAQAYQEGWKSGYEACCQNLHMAFQGICRIEWVDGPPDENRESIAQAPPTPEPAE